jgi:OPA family sugar phosphate sensor protein UhpC-like MFS transporter
LKEHDYKYWRVRVFYSIFIGYIFYYFTRKTFSFAMPALTADLGLTKSDLGIVLTLLSVSYGVSKFVNGIIGDRSNPRYFMAIGLFLTAACNILVGLSSSIVFFAVFWALNGWFQGFGWPASARTLTHWYSRSERGSWWGFWSTSQNIGAALVPFIVGSAVYLGGWRLAFFVPAALCILAGFFVLNRLRDIPQSLGLPPVEVYRNEIDALAPVSEERVFSVKEILVEHVLFNPHIWFLALANFFVYIVRTGVGDWSTMYLMETGGYKEQLHAAGPISLFEIGGFLGMIGAGAASDKIFKGNRGFINLLMMLGILLPIFAFSQVAHGNIFIDGALMFLMGMFLYGPQMLIGCAAAERAHKNAAATASGFAGTFAYIGAAVAGWPLGALTQTYGWPAFFGALLTAAACGALCFVPLIIAERRQALP